MIFSLFENECIGLSNIVSTRTSIFGIYLVRREKNHGQSKNWNTKSAIIL